MWRKVNTNICTFDSIFYNLILELEVTVCTCISNKYILQVYESFKKYLFSSLYRVFIFLLLEMYGTFKKALKTRNVTDSIVVQNAIRAEE